MTSRWIKTAIILLLVALLLYIIGFATISWLFFDNSRESFEIGLWKVRKCTGDYCITGSSGLFSEGKIQNITYIYFFLYSFLQTYGTFILVIACSFFSTNYLLT